MNVAKQPPQTAMRAYLTSASLLHIFAALVVLFSATLHENTAFNAYVFGASVASFGLLRVFCHRFCGAKKLSLFAALQSTIDLTAAVFAVTTAHTAQGFMLTALAWAAARFVLQLLQLQQQQSSKAAVFLTLFLTLMMLVSGSDQVAVIGWFGIYATVYGVFGLISVFDMVTGAAVATNTQQTAAETRK